MEGRISKRKDKVGLKYVREYVIYAKMIGCIRIFVTTLESRRMIRSAFRRDSRDRFDSNLINGTFKVNTSKIPRYIRTVQLFPQIER